MLHYSPATRGATGQLPS